MKPNRDSGFLLHRGTLGLVRLGQSQRNNQYCYQVIFKFLCQKSCELFVISVIDALLKIKDRLLLIQVTQTH